MADIATLGIEVTSRGIPQAEQQLDKLAKTGAKAEQATAKVAPSMDKAAISAKQLAAATRGLPAQFTDIATGLASGQRPLQVLLQQGGQIKDVFGGIGPAVRGVAGYVAGLINPFTIAAAAVGTLAIAWKQAADESANFNRALIISGNRAQLTTQDLRALANQLDATTSATAGKASDVIAQVAATGQFTADQLATVSRAAIQLEEATGQSIEATVRQFNDLRKDPVDAILKLNESQNFLSRSTLETIEKLQDQGRTADAAALAIRAYAETIDQRAPQVVSNLSLIEQVFRNIKQGAGEAFDAIVSGFRDSDRASSIFLKGYAAQLKVLGLGPLSDVISGATDKAKAQRQGSLVDNAIAASVARNRAGGGPAVDSDKERQRQAFERDGLRYLSDRDRLTRDIKDVQALVTAGVIDQAKAEKRIADIKASYAAKSGRGPTAGRTRSGSVTPQRDPAEDAYKRLNEQLAQQIALFGKTGEAARVRYQIENGELAKLAPAKQQELLKQAETLDRLEDEKKAREEVARKIEQEAEAKRRAIENTDRVISDMQFELDLMRMTGEERERAIALRYAEAGATDEQRRAIADLATETYRMREQVGIMDDFRRGLSDSLSDVVTGAKSAKDAFKDFIDDFARRLTELISQKLVERAFGAFGSNGQGTQGGGVLGSLLGAIFGGKREIGGPVTPGRLYEVGEGNRSELFMAGGRQYLIPGNRGAVTPGGGASRSVSLSQTFIVQGTPDRRTREQMARDNGREALRGASRTGR